MRFFITWFWRGDSKSFDLVLDRRSGVVIGHSESFWLAAFDAGTTENAFETIQLPDVLLFVNHDGPCGAPLGTKGAHYAFGRLHFDTAACPFEEDRFLCRVHLAGRFAE